MAEQQYYYKKKINNTEFKAKSLNIQGTAFYLKGDFIKALNKFNRSLKISEYSGNVDRQIASLMNIGNIFQVKEQYNLAFDYYLKALDLTELNKKK